MQKNNERQGKNLHLGNLQRHCIEHRHRRQCEPSLAATIRAAAVVPFHAPPGWGEGGIEWGRIQECVSDCHGVYG